MDLLTPLPSMVSLCLSGAAILWSVMGRRYLNRHLLPPVQASRELAVRHYALTQSTAYTLDRKLHRAKALHLTARHQRQYAAAQRWNRWVYQPVNYALPLAAVACAVWGAVLAW